MKFKAEVDIMPLDALLDPQGKAVEMGLDNLGLKAIEQVRIGKHITFHVEAGSKAEAEKLTEEACAKLLANKVMERYAYTLTEA